MGRKFWKNTEVGVYRVLMFLATSIIAIALLLIIVSILYKGLPSLNWQMLTQVPKGGYYFGKEGGILNAIIGSLYLSFGATILSFIISLPLAVYINIHRAKQKRLVNTVRFLLDLLWGVPSIVYGAFGFTIMIYFGLRASLLAGIITVTLFIIPIMVRSMDEVFKTVPKGLIEAALSLGSTRSETSYKVLSRQCIPGIITAILLAFGRAIGDAAAILFTTGYTDYIPTSLSQPTATLPLSIFFQLGSPIPEVQNRAYASAVVLTVIILIISIISRILSRKYYQERIK
ncbi:MAG: phosphate ABC transporter, permease protein PstA [Bacteroidetes bacterium GWC2_33_15]|nr:MAG: phosphate ABC transporter, permease protein PstA [Bacteroidetes bacterium GWA2_33_15]OFX51864.1 MAG: phosphate ABC transporter, permease protein PstA [Bacteroidetes bacterium GWC2_33_15]OFX63432.1 MAG: phosphate ABC transporter, permease protein PstA [Bacteroidetes bacterium GWB2_32_14]OFX67220.1 MAG: phosphate ABC transporter, permease protein PstA [Bacteroidetes bacterium GWD2_33_33]HAN17054.1 phosphate ABC transporter permease PtsA [Bacteroidales bacterium]